MRDILAEQLLATVMKWDASEIAEERPILQALAAFKYDEYLQYFPGMRFIESLVLWLKQFETDEERKRAYSFVRSRLVFISNAEMKHFVNIAFQDIMRPIMINLAAKQLQQPPVFVRRIVNSIVYKSVRRQSLILGLSDRTYLDQLRRSTLEINHEQVWLTYEMPEKKAGSMLGELAKDLQSLTNKTLNEDEARFRIMFLIDDFCASGLSYFRRDSDTSQYSGKIYRILNDTFGNGALGKLVDLEHLQVHVILYVATRDAISLLATSIGNWLREQERSNEFSISAVQILPAEIKVEASRDAEFFELLPKYFDDQIVDKHYRVGKHRDPYLGFDECALPIVLSHNTPNNSLPLFWFDEHKRYHGLFPRVSRHRVDL